MPRGYIELGGFHIGATDSQFSSYLGYQGDISSDDIIELGAYLTNQISYTFAGTNGFSATLGAEQGNEGYLIDDYMPHVIAGAKFSQGWGAIEAVVGCDTLYDGWAAKVRLDLKFSDTLSAWILGRLQI